MALTARRRAMRGRSCCWTRGSGGRCSLWTFPTPPPLSAGDLPGGDAASGAAAGGVGGPGAGWTAWAWTGPGASAAVSAGGWTSM